MKIAFYNPINISFTSGPEIWLMKMTPILVSLGIEVSIFTTKGGREKNYKEIYEYFESKGVRIIELNYFTVPFSGSMIPTDFHRYKNERFDYFYIFNGFAFQDLLAFCINKLFFKSKFVYGVHAPIMTNYYLHNIYQNLISKNIIKFSDSVHVLNKRDKEYLKDKNYKIKLVGFGVNSKDNRKLVDLKEKLKGAKCKIIFLGRLNEQKNIDKLLEVIKMFEESKDIVFYIAGRGEFQLKVEQLSKSQSNLYYLGYVDNSKLGEVYLDKHYLINLSRYETFCSVVLEALSFGLPVIATKTDGICSDYGEDTLVKSLDIDFSIEDVKSSIEKCKVLFFKDKSKYKGLCNSSLKKAKDFDWDIQAQKFINNLLK